MLSPSPPLPPPGWPTRPTFFQDHTPAGLEQQYVFLLRAYGLSEIHPHVTPDGEATYRFDHYPPTEQALHPATPARVLTAFTYLLDALTYHYGPLTNSDAAGC